MSKITFDVTSENMKTVVNGIEWLTKQERLCITNDGREILFKIDERKTKETDLQLCKRVIGELLKNVVKTAELNEDTKRYEEEIKAIKQPTENVANDIIT